MSYMTSMTSYFSLHYYNTYNLDLPVLLCGSEMWDMTVRSNQRLDAFDQWCLRHILYESLSLLMSPTRKSACDLLNLAPVTVTQTVMLRRLRFFGHIIRSDSDEDHTLALNVGINDPPKEWKRPRGRPRQMATQYAPSRMTSNIRTWGCGRPGTEL